MEEVNYPGVEDVGCQGDEEGWNTEDDILFEQASLLSPSPPPPPPTYSWQDIEEKRIKALNLLARKSNKI